MFQNVVKFTYKTSLMTCSCLCAASFAAQASEMQCLNFNCESLGYTNVENLGNTLCKNFLTCPYDPRYIKCDLLPTCENLGFTNDDKSAWCTNLVRCPTDPSYTLCKSLCSECPKGTALDPAELGCADGYEAAKNQDNTIITNDCDYTCYKCTDVIDTSYYCIESINPSFSKCVQAGRYSEEACAEELCGDETKTECPEGTYIVEVRHPKSQSNADLGPRYVCESCPSGLTNSGENNYDCTINGEAGCDGENFFNSLAECKIAKGECVEHPTAFGICYASSAICGEGALIEYKYTFNGQPLALAGHEWFSKTDSTNKVCYKTTCLTEPDDGVLAAFATEAICKENHKHSNSKGVICKSDGYSCYVFDKCAYGYEKSTAGVTGYSTSCVCETGSYDTAQDACDTVNGSLGSNGSCYTTSTLYDVRDRNGCYYLEFSSCNTPYADINDDETCLCDSNAGYYDNPRDACEKAISGASYDNDRSTCTTTSTIYSVDYEKDCYIAQFDDCNTGYVPDTNGNCVKNTCNFTYTSKPEHSYYTGGTCTDANGIERHEGWECNSGYKKNTAETACILMPYTRTVTFECASGSTKCSISAGTPGKVGVYSAKIEWTVGGKTYSNTCTGDTRSIDGCTLDLGVRNCSVTIPEGASSTSGSFKVSILRDITWHYYSISGGCTINDTLGAISGGTPASPGSFGIYPKSMTLSGGGSCSGQECSGGTNGDITIKFE